MEKQKKDLLVFGYGLPLLITFFVVMHGRKTGLDWVSYMFLGAACIVLIITIVNVDRLKPLYEKWMIGAHFIGTVLTSLILSVLFYIVFGISGIILRILKKDLLDRKLEPQRDSYWLKKEKKPFIKKDYLQQF